MLVFKYILRLESLLCQFYRFKRISDKKFLQKKNLTKMMRIKYYRGGQETRVSLNPLIILYTPFEHNL